MDSDTQGPKNKLLDRMKRTIILISFIGISLASIAQTKYYFPYVEVDSMKVFNSLVMEGDTVSVEGAVPGQILQKTGANKWSAVNNSASTFDSITWNTSRGEFYIWVNGLLTDTIAIDGRYTKLGGASEGQLAVWDDSVTIIGHPELVWNDTYNRLGINLVGIPETELHMVGSIKLIPDPVHEISAYIYFDSDSILIGEGGDQDRLLLQGATLAIRTGGTLGNDGDVLTSDGEKASWEPGADMFKSVYDKNSNSQIDLDAGGTGRASFNAYELVVGTGGSSLGQVSGTGTTGQILTSNGTTSYPTWQNITSIPGFDGLSGGTPTYLPYWTTDTTLGNTVVKYDAVNSRVGVNVTSPATTMHIDGDLRLGQNIGSYKKVQFGSTATEVGEDGAAGRLLLKGNSISINAGTTGLGLNGQVLVSDGTTASWQNVSVEGGGSGGTLAGGVTPYIPFWQNDTTLANTDAQWIVSPSKKLLVNGDGQFGDSSGDSKDIYFGSSNVSVGEGSVANRLELKGNSLAVNINGSAGTSGQLLTSNGTTASWSNLNVDSTKYSTIFRTKELISDSLSTLDLTGTIQNLSKSKTGNSVTVNISEGTGTIFSVADGDSLTTNEIQNLSYTASTRVLAIDGAGSTDATLPLFSTSNTDPGLVNGGSDIATKFLRGDNTWQTITDKYPSSVSVYGTETKRISIFLNTGDSISTQFNDNGGTGADNWGSQVASVDLTMNGDGTSISPLGIDSGIVATRVYVQEAISDSLSGFVATDSQNLSSTRSWNNVAVNISGGSGTIFSVADGDTLSTNELQSLSKSKTGNSVTINILGGSGTTFSVADSDSSTTNEIQTLTYNASTRLLDLSGTATDATLPLFSTSSNQAGLAPGSNSAGSTYFLNGSGTWTVPTGTSYTEGEGIDINTSSRVIKLDIPSIGTTSNPSDDAVTYMPFYNSTTGTHFKQGMSAISDLPFWNAEKIRNINVASTTPTNGQALAYNSTAARWEPTTLGTGVTSFNSRTGAVVPTSGDYSASMVTDAAELSSTNIFLESQTLRASSPKIDLYDTNTSSLSSGITIAGSDSTLYKRFILGYNRSAREAYIYSGTNIPIKFGPGGSGETARLTPQKTLELGTIASEPSVRSNYGAFYTFNGLPYFKYGSTTYNLSSSSGDSYLSLYNGALYPTTIGHNLYLGDIYPSKTTKLYSSTTASNGWGAYFYGGATSHGLSIQAGGATYTPLLVEANDGTDLFRIQGTGSIYAHNINNSATEYSLYYNTSTKEITYSGVPSGTGSSGDMLTSYWDASSNNAIDVSRGGTNLTSYSVGDLIYASGSTALSKLPISTNGYVLTMYNNLPAWRPSASGFANPMTSAGQMIIGGSGGTATVLSAPGAAGLVLTSTGTTGAAWAWPPGGSMTWPTTAGIPVYSGSNSWGTSITLGDDDGTYLKKNGTWGTPSVSASSKWTDATTHVYPNSNREVTIGGTAQRYGRALEVTGEVDIESSSTSAYMLNMSNTASGGGIYLTTSDDGGLLSPFKIFDSALGSDILAIEATSQYGEIYMPALPPATTETYVLKWNPVGGKVTYGTTGSGDGNWSLSGTALAPVSNSYNVSIGKSANERNRKLEVWGSGEFSEDVFVGEYAGKGKKVYYGSTSVHTGEGSSGELYLKGTTLKVDVGGSTGTSGQVLTANGSGGASWQTPASWNYGVQALSISSGTTTWSALSGLNGTISLSDSTIITMTNIVAGMTGNLTVTNASTAHMIQFTHATASVYVSPSLIVSNNKIQMTGSSKVDVLSWYYDGSKLIINGTLNYN